MAGSPAAADSGCDAFAAKGGSNGGSGARSDPYRTPEKLVESLDPGQTGCVRREIYRFDELGISEPRITLAPYGSESASSSPNESPIVPS